MEFKLSKLADPVAPMPVRSGMAPFRNLTIEDAIGDLLRFDWCVCVVLAYIKLTNGLYYRKSPKRTNAPPRRFGNPESPVPALKCDKTKPYCGYNEPQYQLTRPKTHFQAKCREKAASELQHFTRVLNEQPVER